MSIPFDQELTKIRIRMEKAEVEHAKARDLEFATRQVLEQLCIAYYQRAKELGYCGVCEKEFAECKCISLAWA
jgi:hypothetical protein